MYPMMYSYPYYPYRVYTPMYSHPMYWSNPYGGAEFDQRFYWPIQTYKFGKFNAQDFGGEPYVVNIEDAAEKNKTFRTALWTGEHFQVTLMSIGVGEDIGLEIHPSTDQFLRIEEGRGFVQMGDSRDRLNFERRVSENDAIMVPAGKWHNLINTGSKPLKLYTIYAPPEHPFGTVHETKDEAMAAEGHH